MRYFKKRKTSKKSKIRKNWIGEHVTGDIDINDPEEYLPSNSNFSVMNFCKRIVFYIGLKFKF